MELGRCFPWESLSGPGSGAPLLPHKFRHENRSHTSRKCLTKEALLHRLIQWEAARLCKTRCIATPCISPAQSALH